MASDIATATATAITQEDSRRKHHRSPDDEVEESSKRRKHRHHRSRHHRHRSKKHDETKNESESKHEVGFLSGSHLKPDYDMEEGEIVEDADEFEKTSDSGKIDDDNLGVHAEGRSSNTLGEKRSDDHFVTDDAILEKKDKTYYKFCTDTKIEDVVSPGNSKSEHNGFHVNGDLARDSHDKYNTLAQSLSCEKIHEKVSSRSRSISHDRSRDRSRSRSVLQEVAYSKNMHDGWDNEKKVQGSKDHCRNSSDLVRDDEKECNNSSSRYNDQRNRHKSLETWYGDREGRKMDRDVGRENEGDWNMEKDKRREKGREMNRDWEKERERRDREKEHERIKDGEKERRSRDRVKERERSRDRVKERERSRDRDIDRDRIREKEWYVSRDREMDLERRREKEWDRSNDREIENDRQRERERDRSRDMVRERGREKERDRDRNWVRDRERDSGRDRNRDNAGDQDNYMDYRYCENEDRRNRARRNNLEKAHSSKNDSLKEGEEKRKRDEDEQEDYQERISMQLAEQEEEDIDRIKEESRRRRQAILEKYKSQQIQQHVGPHRKDAVKDKQIAEQADKSTTASTAFPDNFDGRNDGADVYVADPSFSVGKSPPQNGVSTFERSSGAGGLGDGTPKSERSDDMFCDDIFGDSPASVSSERSDDMFCDDIFGDSPAGVRKSVKGDGLPIERSGLHDNWDDADGYYSYRFGETLDGRYEITAAHGKGVFSSVVRAKDLKAGNGDPEEVAIKIMRNNETMYKAGQSELVILKKLVGADPENKRHCVRLISSFKYRNHLCLVIESLHMNLREVLKKFGRNIGLKLTAVRAYAKQLFIALKHLRNCGVLHCDIKPDNMLVNEAKNVLKLCDFGNAMFAGKNEITPYLVSRFYRAPEIILGLTYDHPVDIWSVGCCLYELYTGKVLFPGPSNNDMLRLHMELKGPFPKKMLRKGAFIDQHFDPDLNFLAMEEDPVTKKTIRRMIHNIRPKDIGTIIASSPGEDPKMLINFKDLLEKIFVLDPEKRMTVSQALTHPFITGK